MSVEKNFFTSTKHIDDVRVRLEASFSPYDPGVVNAPMEDCYPPEGGELEEFTAWVELGPSTGKFLNDIEMDETDYADLVGRNEFEYQENELYELTREER